MDFYTLYRNIPTNEEKETFRDEIIKQCEIRHSTFYTWLHRKIIPKLAQRKISEILEKDISVLFPKNTKKKITDIIKQ